MSENQTQIQVERARQVIQHAIKRLIYEQQATPQQALEWMMQEARAKKSSLYQVAQAIIQNNELEYCHNVPV